tara:strand:+ start:90 stop:473 length:384 start_codon:yes stop_codon:yes gene_type:complete
MKLTNKQLKQIIKEELNKVLRESYDDEDSEEEGLDPTQQQFKDLLYPELFAVSDISDARNDGILARIFAGDYDEHQLDVKILQLEYEIKKESKTINDFQSEHDRVFPLKQGLIDKIKEAKDDLYGLD